MVWWGIDVVRRGVGGICVGLVGSGLAWSVEAHTELAMREGELAIVRERQSVGLRSCVWLSCMHLGTV